MGVLDEARAEAIKRYSSRLIEDHDGDRYDEDEYGYDATARAAFAAGVEWYQSRLAAPTDDEHEALIRRFDSLRNSGVCSPTTRGLLDDAEVLLRRQGPITDAQKHADDLLAYVDYCLGLPMYQNAISDFGQGSVETLRMVKRTLSEGLHADARAAALEAAERAR